MDGVRDAFRIRLRSVRQGLQTLHRLARRQGDEVAEVRAAIYRKLVPVTERTVSPAERVRAALDAAVTRRAAVTAMGYDCSRSPALAVARSGVVAAVEHW